MPEVVGLFGAPPTQFKFAFHAWELAPLHDEIVPAEAVPAAATPISVKLRVSTATRSAGATEQQFMVWGNLVEHMIMDQKPDRRVQTCFSRVKFFVSSFWNYHASAFQ